MTEAATLTIPPALSAQSLADLREQLDRVQASTPILILRGGKDFCRGLDLGDNTAGAEQAMADFVSILAGLRDHPAAKLALVEGAAMGGGVGLAAVCDLVVATETAHFALPEVLVGLTPATILPILLERVTLQKARAMMLDGGSHTAEQALSLGLVDRICAPEKADQVLARLARALRRSDPHARSRARQATTLPGFRHALEDGARETLARLADPAVRRRIAALSDGRAPWDECQNQGD